MSSLFMRIYLGLLGAIVGIALCTLLGLEQINKQRLQDYHLSVLAPTVRLFLDELEPLHARTLDERLSYYRDELDLNFESVQAHHINFNAQQFTALRERGFALVSLAPPQLELYVYLGEGALLRLRLDNKYDGLMRLSARQLALRLNVLPPSERVAQLRTLAAGFAFPLSLESKKSMAAKSMLLERLEQGAGQASLEYRAQGVLAYRLLQDDPRILRLGALNYFEAYPRLLLSLALLLALLLLSLAIYVLVGAMERRLGRMESAAADLARGNLKSRIKDNGSDSISRLALAFNGMAAHMQRLLDVQKEMIRAVSHELRTPVARLRFGIEMVGDAKSDEERKKHLKGLDGDIDELDSLVDEILTYASLEQDAPAIHFRRCNVVDVMQRVAAEQGPINAHVKIQCLSSALSDAQQKADVEERYMHRALQNLVGNACRYAESEVRLSFSASAQSCRLDVEDDGLGIPQAQWERVFSPFTRLDDSRDRASGGYGLGLSIVRRILYWHNGRAMVGRSELGGAKFSLVWPRDYRG